MNRRYRVIEIPLKASTEEEVIELSIDNLPDVAELVDLLRNELSPLSLWLHAALTYYREGKEEEFRDILETVRADTEKSHLQLTPWILEMSTMPDYKQDLLRILDTLAAYYVAQANKERNRERKKELQNKVAVLYTAGDKLTTESQNHLVGRAFFLLVDLNQNNFANALDQADQQFTFVFNNNNANIPTLVGKACISFNKKDYKGALTYYRRCLRNNPQCPANIRLGMGHCFYKLNQLEKARLAFERALKLDHKCVGAMVALAIMELNKKNPEAIQNGVQMLSRAYNIDKTHPMVLNHLADHFFFKRDYQRVHQLALHAFQNTENEFMRAESSYQLGRAYHIQENYNQAFQYYYQSTQFAAPSFVLPFYGLGQMYIFRGDLENAAVCFDRVLKFYPNNYETMKILGSIYAQSADPAKRGMARDYLKKVTEAHPDDVEAWIELAQILEQFDLQGALNSYNNAIKIFKEIAENTGREEPEIPAEIYNNVAVLHYRLGAFEAAEENLERSLRVANDEAEHDEAYFRLIQVSIRYNFGRLYEAAYRLVKANEVYVALLRDHPTHTDSMIRLGCLRREACHIYEASDWFKEVLQVDKDNADAWILIANMHCAKSEWGPGQKKYERVLGAEATKDDTYALVALGNIWLHTLFSGGKGGGTREEREKERRHQERAISMYRNALRQDELNLYAANGIGCVLAAKGAFNEARDVFSQVREATADFPDVWVNIAHIYVETRQYVNAIQMYENCHRRFYPAPNTEILMYIARAYYRWGRMRQCKTVLLRIRHVTPNDATVIFNLALVLQRIAASVLEEPKCPLRTILSAVHELNLAHRYFDHLRLNPEPTKFDPVAAGAEEQRCKDLITQAQHHVARARRADAEEQEARRRQEAERAALRAKAQEESRAREEERRKVEKELIAKRQEFVAKTKSILIFDPQMEEKPKKGGGGGGRGRKSAHHGEDGFVTDSSSNIENRTAGGGGEKTGGKKKKKKKEGKRGRKRRNRGSGGSAESDEEGGGGEVNEEERRKRREERQQQKRKKQRKGGQKESAKKGRPSKPEKAEQP
ncbi:PREDICTED: RNA polymerase-associated protein CTR9 homolog, partial [Rhagoletis zephyria]|uniref:RNA polymerase-associated protein CTR9 homolog n=1 Tax=Rhagoletis zephyria TaxID=28612 RepID=UPI00081137AE